MPSWTNTITKSGFAGGRVGTWWDEEPGTVRGHLYQQNTLRDAFVAALTLDVFHKYTDRVVMANIAQMVNIAGDDFDRRQGRIIVDTDLSRFPNVQGASGCHVSAFRFDMR